MPSLRTSPRDRIKTVSYTHLPNKGGPLKFFYRIFNRGYDATASGYTKVCHFLTLSLIHI